MEGISKREAHRGGQKPQRKSFWSQSSNCSEPCGTSRGQPGHSNPWQHMLRPSYVKIFPVAGHQDGLHSRALSLTKP
jgi:hypothetical protein